MSDIPNSPAFTMGYFRHPDIPDDAVCARCGHVAQEHGWIDSGGEGITVCPSWDYGPFHPNHRGAGSTQCENCDRGRK